MGYYYIKLKKGKPKIVVLLNKNGVLLHRIDEKLQQKSNGLLHKNRAFTS